MKREILLVIRYVLVLKQFEKILRVSGILFVKEFQVVLGILEFKIWNKLFKECGNGNNTLRESLVLFMKVFQRILGTPGVFF
mgnify:CR=1